MPGQKKLEKQLLFATSLYMIQLVLINCDKIILRFAGFVIGLGAMVLIVDRFRNEN